MKILALVCTFAMATPVAAATFKVGPGRPHQTLTALFDAVDLGGGDVVEVDFTPTPYGGGVVMPSNDGGAPGNPVVIRGIAAGTARPHLRGGNNTIEFLANHVVFDNMELSGTGSIVSGTFRCVFHHSHDLTLRQVYVHDCPRHGVLGADTGSGSLTIEYSEIFNAGSNTGNHAIYMATDELAYPGAVFRLQHSYVHDSRFDDTAVGGNLIKSRAERNEIYYNWLEGAYYHELELIGPDPAGAAAGWNDALAREDSDVVGYVIVHTSGDFSSIIRIGGDGTSGGRGESNGRYRFVNNTIVATAGSATPNVFRTHFGIESVEMHNNVIWRAGATAMRIIREETPTEWVLGSARISGSNNWVESNATFVPVSWGGPVSLTDEPGFANSGALDFRPALGSLLLHRGASPPISLPGYEVAQPLFPPAFLPPQRSALSFGTAAARPQNGIIDLGAFELPNVDVLFAHGFEN